MDANALASLGIVLIFMGLVGAVLSLAKMIVDIFSRDDGPRYPPDFLE